MQIENYLKTYQPVIYKTFSNILENDQLSHAYLLYGQVGTPLMETALFLAKSILCDSPNPLACNSCLTCLRIDDGNYSDFIVFDGSKSTIKKEDIATIESSFELKAFESKGTRIYILHLIENMTTEAINALLKFLEEPGSKIYAFLTTNNENSILPTITSRCQTLRLKMIERNEVIKQAIELGCVEENAELLSYQFNSGELINDKLSDEDFSETFLIVKECFFTLINSLASNNKESSYIFDKEILPKIKEKESLRLFIDCLTDLFEDLVAIKHGNTPYLKSCGTILKQLANNLTNIESKLTEILKQRNMVNLNVNASLLLDRVLNTILKE